MRDQLNSRVDAAALLEPHKKTLAVFISHPADRQWFEHVWGQLCQDVERAIIEATQRAD